MLEIEPESFKKSIITISLYDAETHKPVEGIKAKPLKLKHSWTEEQLTNKINGILAKARISLTGKSGEITAKNNTENNSSQSQSKNQEQSNNQEHQFSEPVERVFGQVPQKVENAITRIMQNAQNETGWNSNELLGKIEALPGKPAAKLNYLKLVRSGWKKLTDEERELFTKLQ